MIEGSARDALAAPAVAADVVVLPVAGKTSVAETGSALSALKNIALFFAAPFIGLAYIIALPIVGLGFFAMLAMRVASKSEAVRSVTRTLRHVGMFIAAPFLGLAAVVFFPFIGLAMLMWMAGKAAVARAKD